MHKLSYIIIQAGGKGTRLERLTRNKPKALVPVENLPILFHLFRKYPKNLFVIIGDYKFDVLEHYLEAFATVNYKLIDGKGDNGTCAGLRQALTYIPSSSPFMLIWADLVLPDEFTFPEELKNYIGVSKDFLCRWSYFDGHFYEKPSECQGVAGLFIFQDKSILKEVPRQGEFVHWLQEENLSFKELPLYHTKEYGLISEYNKLPQQCCRPFNKIIIEKDYIIKDGIDAQGKALAIREAAWYRKLNDMHFDSIPRIYGYNPLKMERIIGKNVYEYVNLSVERKVDILKQIITCLKYIHSMEDIPSDFSSFNEAYIGKTFMRLQKIRRLVPFADRNVMRINGRECRNVFFYRKDLERKIAEYFPLRFKLIHGDCTFSNILLRDNDRSPVLIDPRGYFGTTEIYGDPAYEWAKIYYSIVGNYDQFNLKRFDLYLGEKEINLEIASNGWEDIEDIFFSLLKDEIDRQQIKLLHAIIWLSLTTYAWEDYDSICGAFYNGLYLLEEVL
jgi:GTP:adenosylcobinamide-phosphate guanylyltransferase/tRNA A-37 threonylcarbamoyl transferase component Bud32